MLYPFYPHAIDWLNHMQWVGKFRKAEHQGQEFETAVSHLVSAPVACSEVSPLCLKGIIFNLDLWTC